MTSLDLTNRQNLEGREKLPKPTNDNLEKLFLRINKIVIKNGGVYENKAISDEILLVIDAEKNIKTFRSLLRIDEKNTGFYCMCLGTYAIELISDNLLKSTIGFHHGVSIRYDKWNGDAELLESEALLRFLAELGFTKPLNDRIKEFEEGEKQKIEDNKWLSSAPKSFSKYWEQMKSMQYDFISELQKELKAEIPDKNKLIIEMLQLYGYSQQFWSGYPVYQDVPSDILTAYNFTDILSTYERSDRNYKTRKGLGRFLLNYNNRKNLKKIKKIISHEIIDDIEKCFNWLNDEAGIKKLENLKK
jgi:hypothetical protein